MEMLMCAKMDSIVKTITTAQQRCIRIFVWPFTISTFSYCLQLLPVCTLTVWLGRLTYGPVEEIEDQQTATLVVEKPTRVTEMGGHSSFKLVYLCGSIDMILDDSGQ